MLLHTLTWLLKSQLSQNLIIIYYKSNGNLVDTFKSNDLLTLFFLFFFFLKQNGRLGRSIVIILPKPERDHSNTYSLETVHKRP